MHPNTNRKLFTLWNSQLLGQLGSQAFLIGIIFLLKHKTQSGSWIGMLLMVSQIPAILMGPIAGALADRLDRKKLWITSDLITGFIILSLALILSSPVSNQLLFLGVVFLASAGVCIMTSIAQPAIISLLPEIVGPERLLFANSLHQGTLQIGRLAASALGGSFLVVYGTETLLLVSGSALLVAPMITALLPSSRRAQVCSGEVPRNVSIKRILHQFYEDVRGGALYVWKQPEQRTFFVMAASLNFFIAPVMVVLPFLVEDHLRLDASWFGYLMGAEGAGVLLGYLLVVKARLGGVHRAVLVFAGFFGLALCEGLLGWSGSLALVFSLIFASGVCIGAVNVNVVTILQQSTPSALRGRVFGFVTALSAAAYPVGSGISGILLDMLGGNLSIVLTVCGVSLGILALWLLLKPGIMGYLARDLETANLKEA